MSLYSELKRRNVFRVAVAYLAAAWLLTEVAGTLLPGFGIPDWAFRFLVIVLILGFLPTLVFSWAYEITPQGLKREKDVVRDGSISHITARRLDGITILLVALALGFVLVDRFWLTPRLAMQPNVPVEGDSMNASGPETEAGLVQFPPRSIVVLPFVNVSDDPSNDYFSDGISEELLNLLTKIPELHVVSRASAFSFKGKNIDIPTIASRLKVAHVLEGSVRTAGNRIRISTQLVDVASDTNLWTQTFDRTLDDVFAIQEEIAKTVVDQLKIKLLGDAPRVEVTNPAAYALFLQARQLGNQFTVQAFERSNELYQQALDIDSNFAAAWSGLAHNYLNQAGYADLSFDKGRSMALQAAQRALDLNPDYAQAHVHLARIALEHDLDLARASRHIRHALALEPTNPIVLNRAIAVSYCLGLLEQAVEVGEYVVRWDPINPESYYYLGVSYLWSKRLDEAITSFRTALSLSPGYIMAHYRIGVALLLKGEPRAALVEMQRELLEEKRLEGMAIAHHLLGQPAQSDAALTELINRYEKSSSYNIAYVFALRGDADQAFAWLDKAVQNRDTGLSQIAYQPEFTSIHEDRRWLPFLEQIGMAPAQLDAVGFKVNLPN